MESSWDIQSGRDLGAPIQKVKRGKGLQCPGIQDYNVGKYDISSNYWMHTYWSEIIIIKKIVKMHYIFL